MNQITQKWVPTETKEERDRERKKNGSTNNGRGQCGNIYGPRGCRMHMQIFKEKTFGPPTTSCDLFVKRMHYKCR